MRCAILAAKEKGWTISEYDMKVERKRRGRPRISRSVSSVGEFNLEERISSMLEVSSSEEEKSAKGQSRIVLKSEMLREIKGVKYYVCNYGGVENVLFEYGSGDLVGQYITERDQIEPIDFD